MKNTGSTKELVVGAKGWTEWAWDRTEFSGRLCMARACGWALRTATRIARTSWINLTPAAQAVLVRNKPIVWLYQA